MSLADCLDINRVEMDVALRSRKHALEYLSNMLAGGDSGLSAKRILQAFVRRERLGCTAISGGIALPHGRLRNAVEPVAAFVRCAEPLDFDTPDGFDVEFVFAVVYPEDPDEATLENLRNLAAVLGDEALQQSLRDAGSSAEAHAALAQSLQDQAG